MQVSINDIGRYLALPREWSVARTGPNNLPTFVCTFDLTSVQNGDDWTDCAADQLEITGYFYLMKKDGQPNEFTINALKNAMGWAGDSFQKLNDTDWGGVTVQLTIDAEEFEGKKKVKIAFINHKDDSRGGVPRSDPQTIKSLDEQFGATLRALSKKNGATAAKPANSAKPPLLPETAAAWRTFLNKNPTIATSDRGAAWKAALAQYFGEGVEPGALAAAQWVQFGKDVEAHYDPSNGFPLAMRHRAPAENPLSEEPQFQEQEIPY